MRYQISTNSWTTLTPAGGYYPPMSAGTLLARDPRSRSVFVWGSNANDNSIHNFNLDTFTWTVESSGGTPIFNISGKADPLIRPSKTRKSAGVAFGGRLYLHGGDGGTTVMEGPGGGFPTPLLNTSLFTYDILCPQLRSLNAFGDCVCAAGTRKSGGSCLPCPLGNTSLPDSSSCQLCPGNTFGEISNLTGAPTCTPCPVGSASDPGSVNCTVTTIDTCPTLNTCSRCTSRLCSWCNGTCQQDGSNSTCVQICPRRSSRSENFGTPSLESNRNLRFFFPFFCSSPATDGSTRSTSYWSPCLCGPLHRFQKLLKLHCKLFLRLVSAG